MPSRTLSIVFFLVAAFVGAALPVHAQPRGVRLTHYGDPTRSIAISWNSASASDNQVVVGTSAADLSRSVAATDTFAMRGALGTGFSARVDGLDPSTLYYYRVGHAGAWRPAESSPPYSFRTLPADRCAPLRVIIIGDNRSDFDGRRIGRGKPISTGRSRPRVESSRGSSAAGAGAGTEELVSEGFRRT